MKNLLKRNKKNIFNGSFLIILFMITLYYVFHGSGDSLSEVWAKMQMADPVWVVLSVIFIVLFIYVNPILYIIFLEHLVSGHVDSPAFYIRVQVFSLAVLHHLLRADSLCRYII